MKVVEGVPIVFSDDWLIVVDKPAGLVVHPAPGHHGPYARRRAARDRVGRRARAPRDRPPPRPRHIGADDRRAHATRRTASSPPRSRRARSNAPTRRSSRATWSRAAGRSTRRSGATTAPRRGWRWGEGSARGADPLRGRRARCRPTASYASGSRPAARTRSAPISRRSAIPSPATRDTAHAGRHGLGAPVPARSRLGFRHPVAGDALSFESSLPGDLEAALERAGTA